MKFGARIFKTGLAVLITLTICHFFNMDSAMIAVVASVIGIQPSLKKSSEYMWQQIQANAVGTVAAVIFLQYFGNGPIVAAFVVMLTIALNMKFKMEKSIPLAVITVLAIMEITNQHIVVFALERFLLIMLGITVSLVINHIFATRNYDKKLQKEFLKLEHISDTLFKTISSPSRNLSFVKEKITEMSTILGLCSELFSFYKDDYYWILYKKKNNKRSLLMHQRMVAYYTSLHELFNRLAHAENQKILVHSEQKDVIVELLANLNTDQQKFFLHYDEALNIDTCTVKEINFENLYQYVQGASRENLNELSLVVRIYDQIKQLYKLKTILYKVRTKKG